MIEALAAGREIPPGTSHLHSVAARAKARLDGALAEAAAAKQELTVIRLRLSEIGGP